MRDCKDCIHYAPCRDWYGSENGMPNYADDIDCSNYEEKQTEQERKHGKWLYDDFTYPECNLCGYTANEATNYCPNCGAYMRNERVLEYADQSGLEWADNPVLASATREVLRNDTETYFLQA